MLLYKEYTQNLLKERPIIVLLAAVYSENVYFDPFNPHLKPFLC